MELMKSSVKTQTTARIVISKKNIIGIQVETRQCLVSTAVVCVSTDDHTPNGVDEVVCGDTDNGREIIVMSKMRVNPLLVVYIEIKAIFTIIKLNDL
jgi:hypothetical protein